MGRACGPPGPARSALACTVLLLAVSAGAVHAAPDNNLPKGICSSMDIKTTPENIQQALRGCRVIEGVLKIVLMERANEKTYENMTFPELREVTGYIIIYRMRGIKNLGHLFPNLAVVRGMQLFKDFAVVIFDNQDLEAVGLRSLTVVERGGIRIERNDRLCYIHTINWSLLNPNDSNSNILRSNYDVRFCGICPNGQSRVDSRRLLLGRSSSLSAGQCPTSHDKPLCWDEKNCQKTCKEECGRRGCLNNGTCCHVSCLGGCDGLTAMDCHACKNFSYEIDQGQHKGQRVCIDFCPAGQYELFHRCVTETACRAMSPPPPLPESTGSMNRRFATSIGAYKIHNNKCVYICPSGYMEEGDVHNAKCVPCPKEGGCIRECAGGKIDSVAAAEQFRGCTHIKGKLEITLRASGGNTLSVLESSLGEIREINGCLLVTRSYPLVSLMFLKNLKKIVGTRSEECSYKGHVLHILNNPNLELLWDWSSHGNINISGGTLFIHLNPKLCYNQLLPLKNMTSNPKTNFTEIEVSEDSNGNQASCLPGKLNLEVSELRNTAVVLKWNIYCPDDMRKLLGYSIYYIATETNVTLYEQRDACSDIWNVLDVTKDEARNNTIGAAGDDLISNKTDTDLLFNGCNNLQPSFAPVSQLYPYTRYAAYVKTYTTLQDKNGAQSSIIYFRTLPGSPSPPLGLTVQPVSPHEVHIRWQPPASPNGTVILYHVEVQANSYNRDQIMAGRQGSTDSCTNPNALSSLIASRVEGKEKAGEEAHDEEDLNIGKNGTSFGKNGTFFGKDGTCSCKEDVGKPTKSGSTRFNQQDEEERDDSIQFENELQNMVYVKNVKQKPKTSSGSRVKRSVDKSLNNMLVKLTANIGPRIQPYNYSNTTDSRHYVQSLYYELDGGVRQLTVKHMRHFTWYTVNVWACRAKHPDENVKAYENTWCSTRSYYTFLTSDLPDADAVSGVHAAVVNKTLPDVNVTWHPPANPNGFVVAYNVHSIRVEDGTQQVDVGRQYCTTPDEYESSTQSYMVRNLAPGNYSIRITPITVRGPGNSSAEVFVLIPERTIDSGYEWVWGVVCGVLVMLLILAGVIWYVKRGLLPATEAHKLFASVNPEYVSTVYVPDEWEVPRSSIEFIKELGQGSFGMVYEGIAKNIEKGKPETRCAVKTVNEHATDRERIEFLNEASVMKAFDTHHVVRLLGVVSRGQPTLVVMELMESGDLKTYLRSHRPDAESSLPKKDPAQANTPPTLQNILQMAIEIADGMAYLSAKKFVHRDLAARNCMVAGDLTVKVGDFGMTRDIYETDYYRKGTKGLLPVRWMSPESLKDGVFSSYSDVWSYGVVLWEMATLAMQPYQGLSNEQVVRYVVEGGVMERPEHCPDRLYELMRACWAHRPAARPTFLHLVADLAPAAMPHFRHRSFFHSAQGQEMYALQRSALEEEPEVRAVNVGAVATGSGSNLFGVSGRLASWVRELSSLRSRPEDDAAAEPLQPLALPPPNGGIVQPP